MHRRRYLALVGTGVTVGLAGCGGTDDSDNVETPTGGGVGTTAGVGEPGPGGGATGTEQTTTLQSDAQTTESTTTETTVETTNATTNETAVNATTTESNATTETTADGEPGDISTLTIDGSVLADAGLGGYGKHVEVTVTNQGNASSGEVTVTVRWYDENGTLVTTTTGIVPRLAGGETAVVSVPVDAAGVDPESVASYDVSVPA